MNLMRSGTIAFGFALYATIVIGFSLAASWYEIEYEFDFYSMQDTYTHEIELYDEYIGKLTSVFVILGFIFTILLMVFTFIYDKKPIFGIISLIIGISAFLFILISSLYFYNGMIENGKPFWHTESESFGDEGISFSYGPGVGWYLAVVASVINLIALGYMVMGVKRSYGEYGPPWTSRPSTFYPPPYYPPPFYLQTSEGPVYLPQSYVRGDHAMAPPPGWPLLSPPTDYATLDYPPPHQHQRPPEMRSPRT